MARQSTSLVVPDLSSFTRSLARSLSSHRVVLGHVELQNLIARAAGYPNLQALKAAPSAVTKRTAPAPLSANARRALSQFDARGRLLRWPTKFTLQRMAMWPLWTLFDAKRIYTEREVNAILRAFNDFGDHVTLRRELINHKLLARKADCSEYWKVSARPDEEIRSLLSAWRERRQAGDPQQRNPAPLTASPEASPPSSAAPRRSP